jgi:hypothetical protein
MEPQEVASVGHRVEVDLAGAGAVDVAVVHAEELDSYALGGGNLALGRAVRIGQGRVAARQRHFGHQNSLVDQTQSCFALEAGSYYFGAGFAEVGVGEDDAVAVKLAQDSEQGRRFYQQTLLSG